MRRLFRDISLLFLLFAFITNGYGTDSHYYQMKHDFELLKDMKVKGVSEFYPIEISSEEIFFKILSFEVNWVNEFDEILDRSSLPDPFWLSAIFTNDSITHFLAPSNSKSDYITLGFVRSFIAEYFLLNHYVMNDYTVVDNDPECIYQERILDKMEYSTIERDEICTSPTSHRFTLERNQDIVFSENASFSYQSLLPALHSHSKLSRFPLKTKLDTALPVRKDLSIFHLDFDVTLENQVVNSGDVSNTIRQLVVCASDHTHTTFGVKCQHDLTQSLSQLSVLELSKASEYYLTHPTYSKSFLHSLAALDTSSSSSIISKMIKENGYNKDLIEPALFYLSSIKKVSLETLQDLIDILYPSYGESNLVDVNNTLRNTLILTAASIANKLKYEDSDVVDKLLKLLHSELDNQDFSLNNSTLYPSILLDAIGNVAHAQSLEYLHSYIKGESYQSLLSAIYALRHYTCQSSLDLLSTQFTLSEDSILPTSHAAAADVATTLYSRHPLANEDTVHKIQRAKRNAVNEESYRHKRDTGDQIYHVQAPGVGWVKRFGDTNIGVEFGTRVNNGFHITTSDVESTYNIDFYIESWNIAHFYAINKQNSFRASACLQGEIKFDLNVLTDFDIEGTVRKVNKINEVFGDVTASLRLTSNSLDSYLNTYTFSFQLPDFISVSVLAAEYQNQLTSFSSNSLYNNATILYDRIQTILANIAMNSDSYQVLFSELEYHLDGLLNNISQAEIYTSSLSNYIDLYPQRPRYSTDNMQFYLRELSSILDNLESISSLTQTLSATDNPMNLFLTPDIDLSSLIVDTENLIKDANDQGEIGIETILTSKLLVALQILSDIPQQFIIGANKLISDISTVQALYLQLQHSYETARFQVDLIFGQRFYHTFPNKIKSCDSVCGCGSYPSTTLGRYPIGIDVSATGSIMNPFSGYLQLDNSSNSSILIQPDDFSLPGLVITIYNIQPASFIGYTSVYVQSGIEIGSPISSVCPSSFIHVSAKRLVNTTHSVSLDPTQYLHSRSAPNVEFAITCNSYTIEYKGMIIERKELSSLVPTEEAPIAQLFNSDEFPPLQDLVLSEQFKYSTESIIQFSDVYSFTVGGVIPVQFTFTVQGPIEVEVNFTSKLLSRTFEADLHPSVSSTMYGEMRVGSGIYALINVTGDLLVADWNTHVEHSFNGWPFSATSYLDIVVLPSTVDLNSQLLQSNLAGNDSPQLLSYTSIWHYHILPVSRRAFSFSNTLSDITSPVTTSETCTVYQLPNRHISLPALFVSFDATDPESYIQATISIGSDVKSEIYFILTELEGSTIVIPQTLVSGIPLVVTVNYINSQGLTALQTCVQQSLDTTPPTGTFLHSHLASCHPSQLLSLLTILDDTELLPIQYISLGSQPGLYGDDILPWQEFNTSLLFSPATMIGLGHYFQIKNTRLSFNPVMVLNGVTNLDCATECDTDFTCLSFDYSNVLSNCLLHPHLAGYHTDTLTPFYSNPPEIVFSKSYNHFIKIGNGLSAMIFEESLSLESNVIYYFNARITNQLGFSNIISSAGITVDFSTPNPPNNPIIYVSESNLDCNASILQYDCDLSSVTSLNNSIIFSDMYESGVIFNGHERGSDSRYFSTNHFISANWLPFVDDESGIFGYTWCVGTTVGSCDVIPFNDPHDHLTDPSEWSLTGIQTNLRLTDGNYYVTVQAINNAEYGGRLVTTLQHTTPYFLDTTYPEVQILHLQYDLYNDLLTVEFNASDNDSDIEFYLISLGTSDSTHDILDWTTFLKDDGGVFSVYLPGGLTFVNLRVTNYAGLASDTIPESIFIDREQPTYGYVYDGMDLDIDYWNSTTYVCVNFGGFSLSSSTLNYQWILKEASTNEILFNKSLLNNGTSFCSPVSILHNTRYYSTITAYSSLAIGFSLPLMSSAISDGFLVDNTPPSSNGTLQADTKLENGTHISSPNSLFLAWVEFQDEESYIQNYFVNVYGSNGLLSVTQLPGTVTFIHLYNLQFMSGEVIRVMLKARNFAGGESFESITLTVDLLPPLIDYIFDGNSSYVDEQHQDTLYELNAVFSITDLHSSIIRLEVSAYRKINDTSSVLIFPNSTEHFLIPPGAESVHLSGLDLFPTEVYFIRIVATDESGLTSIQDSNGISTGFLPQSILNVAIDPSMLSIESNTSTIPFSDRVSVILTLDSTDMDLDYYIGVVYNDNDTLVFDYVSIGTSTRGNILFPFMLSTDGTLYKLVAVALDQRLNDLQSKPVYSAAFQIQLNTGPGVVYNLPSGQPKISTTFQDFSDIIIIYFSNFTTTCSFGFQKFFWAIGLGGTDLESLLEFTDFGIIVDYTSGDGRGQILLPHLSNYIFTPLYSTIRGFTYCGEIIEATSPGLVIDPSPPTVKILGIGKDALVEANSGQVITGNHPVYLLEDVYTVIWTASDTSSFLSTQPFTYSLGYVPFGEEILSNIDTTDLFISPSTALPGISSHFTISSYNRAGLTTTMSSPVIIADPSPPIIGIIDCPYFIHTDLDNSRSIVSVHCELFGFNDLESGISYIIVSFGAEYSAQSLMEFTRFPGYIENLYFPSLSLLFGTNYFMTFKIFNGAGLYSVTTSHPIILQQSPPLWNDLSFSIVSDAGSYYPNHSSLIDIPVSSRCLLNIHVLQINFMPPQLSNSDNIIYEISIGSSRSNYDILYRYPIYPIYLHDGLLSIRLFDFVLPKDVLLFTSVMVTSDSGISNSFLATLIFTNRSRFSDIATSNHLAYSGSSRYQPSQHPICSQFFFNECLPIFSRWRILSLFNMSIVQEFTDFSPNFLDVFFTCNHYLSLFTGESFLIIASILDSTGITQIFLVDVLTITSNSPSVGFVYDGNLTATDELDQNYQLSTSEISAFWGDFGLQDTAEEILYFQIAIGNQVDTFNGRTSIIGFLDVQKLQKITISSLVLFSEERYYVSIRSYSVSGLYADLTSNGISVISHSTIFASNISLNPFQSDTNYLFSSWTPSLSSVPIREYHWGAGIGPFNDSTLLLFCSLPNENYSSILNVFEFENVELELSAYSSELTLVHGLSYYVVIRIYDESGLCLATVSDNTVLIDTSSPIVHQVIVQSDITYYNLTDIPQVSTYIRHSDMINVLWEDFTDDESPIDYYKVALFQIPHCYISEESSFNLIKEAITDQRTYFHFTDLHLSEGNYYAIKVSSTNMAGLTSYQFTESLILDELDPVAGRVIIGQNIDSSLHFLNNVETLIGMFSYFPRENQNADLCFNYSFYSLRDEVMNWHILNSVSFIGGPPELFYNRSQISFHPNFGTRIEMEYRTTGSLIDLVTGAYQSRIYVYDGITLSIDISAASGDNELEHIAVTSVLLSDGPASTIYEFFSGEDILNPGFSAIGFQIFRTHSDENKVRLWAMFESNLVNTLSVDHNISYDIFQSLTYKIQIDKFENQFESVSSVSLYIEDTLIGSLYGAPVLSNYSYLTFHVFNNMQNFPQFLPSILPSVVAVFSNLTISEIISELCKYLPPFYSSSPIVHFQAFISTEQDLFNSQNAFHIDLPCTICPINCSYNCYDSCNSHHLLVPFVIDYPFRYISDLFTPISDFIPYVYLNISFPGIYLTLRAISASGRFIDSSRISIIVDLSPPTLVRNIEHFDVNFDCCTVVLYQSNEETISVSWDMKDVESGISEYFFAIGTSIQGTEIYPFTSNGVFNTLTLSGLSLCDDTTYYTTIIGINGAGLNLSIISTGVTVLLAKPSPMSFTIVPLISSSSLVNNYESNTLQRIGIITEDGFVSLSWTSNDSNLSTFSWSIGSAPNRSDILPKVDLGYSLSAKILGSIVYSGELPIATIAEIRALQELKEVDQSDNIFHLEPGVLFYHNLIGCTKSNICVSKTSIAILLLRSSDFSLSGTEDFSVTFQKQPISGSSRTLDLSYAVLLQTKGGFAPYSEIYFGYLQHDDIHTNYSISSPYISNPSLSMSQTSLSIARRFTRFAGPSFYISFLGIPELNGPLNLSVDFQNVGIDWPNIEAYPELLYWDTNASLWREASSTCGTDTIIDYVSFKIYASVCSTDSQMPSSLFFDRATQFIVGFIGPLSINTPPNLNFPSTSLEILEDTYFETDLSIYSSDIEGDTFKFYLSSLPTYGEANITMDGILSYFPCKYCSGMDSLLVSIFEEPFGINERLFTSSSIYLSIIPVNNPPKISHISMLSQSEFIVLNSNRVQAQVYANRTNQSVGKFLLYDIDGHNDVVTLQLVNTIAHLAGFVSLQLLDGIIPIYSLPVNLSNTEYSSFDGEINVLLGELVIVFHDIHFYGNLNLTLYGFDSSNAFSNTLYIDVSVSPNPCLNDGICIGPINDSDCALSPSFPPYFCDCSYGYDGTICEIDSFSDISSSCDSTLICQTDPCYNAICPSHPNAICSSDNCGSCSYYWSNNDTIVTCTTQDTSLCYKPDETDPNAAIECNAPAGCDCPSFPFVCPSDSKIQEVRTSLCCIEFICVCNECPNSIQCGTSILPYIQVGGNSLQGSCCPQLSYIPFNECEIQNGECSHECQSLSNGKVCLCPNRVELASDGVNCGVCINQGLEFSVGDRTTIGCSDCFCRIDDIAGDRWECSQSYCNLTCKYNGILYPVGEYIFGSFLNCLCEPTDISAEWTCIHINLE